MHEPSYLDNIALLLIWIRMVLTQNKSSDIQRFSHLQMPTTDQYWTGITVLNTHS